MAASCIAIPLSSSSSSNAILKSKTLISSSSEILKIQVPCSISFRLFAPSLPLVAKNQQTKVSSSNFSVLNEEAVEGEEIDGESVVSDGEAEKKKERPCELYVCNLPRSYDIPQLLEMFQPYGTVISIEVSRNPETGESRGSGYVTMSSVYSAKIAIAALDGSEVGGREMRVRFSVEMNPGARRNPAGLNSTPKKILIYESQYKIYVGNLPWATKPGDLRNHFSRFGTIVSVRVLHDRKVGKNRVFAFLSYSKPEERDAAISLTGTEFQGRRIVVREGIERDES
ncbi:PREDICTED: 31 kDa ribonucleoprotein, chloroplastic-like [Tarenaya hassleriana]|uniref:31 kDa ribonucleoprotein, chloroplastic-like n=1 Tax=Tarenaya hassleriana TaxID=28532 RepID=UPI00053C3561|nr:PREDICTED: 31 kDa ribonucleoprotein, chloroplastic-like [Tarenaya hassleriana]